jgi:hypothetical protein
VRSYFRPFTGVLRKIFGSLTREVWKYLQTRRIRLRLGYGVTGYADATDRCRAAVTVVTSAESVRLRGPWQTEVSQVCLPALEQGPKASFDKMVIAC